MCTSPSNQGCSCVHGPGECFPATPTVGLYLGAPAASADMGWVELGEPEGVGPICSLWGPRTDDGRV